MYKGRSKSSVSIIDIILLNFYKINNLYMIYKSSLKSLKAIVYTVKAQ